MSKADKRSIVETNFLTTTVKRIYMISGDVYENVKFFGPQENFENAIEGLNFVKVYVDKKAIRLNTSCIESVELEV